MFDSQKILRKKNIKKKYFVIFNYTTKNINQIILFLYKKDKISEISLK